MKTVKGIFVNSEKRTVELIRFDGSYESIQDILGGDVYWNQTHFGDFIYYNRIDDIDSEHFLSFGDEVYRGNIFITGDVKEGSDEWNWSCKNVHVPIQLIEEWVRFHNISEVKMDTVVP